MDRFSRLSRRSHGVRRASHLPGIVSVLLFVLLSLRVGALSLDGHAAAAETVPSGSSRAAGARSTRPGEAASVRRHLLPGRTTSLWDPEYRPVDHAASWPGNAPILVLAAASDEKLQRCRYLHRRIEHFTRLRRSGGSGAQMERWRRSRQRFEEEYRRKRCFRFGRKLKDLR